VWHHCESRTPAELRYVSRKKMSEKSIRDRLVERGQTLFSAPKQPIPFTKEPQADALLNDLDNHPHAFVLACVMDRQVKAERAWLIPYRISEKIGGFSMQALRMLSAADVYRLMKEPEPLHRFVDTMSDLFYAAVQRVKNNYAGDAARIWSDKPSSAEVVYRFLEFDGVGPKIGSILSIISSINSCNPLSRSKCLTNTSESCSFVKSMGLLFLVKHYFIANAKLI